MRVLTHRCHNTGFGGDRNGVPACVIKCAKHIAQEGAEFWASTETSDHVIVGAYRFWAMSILN